MAINNKKNRSIPIRANPEFEKMIKQIMAKNLMRGKNIKTSRVTLAILRQYKKYPELLKELEEAELK